MEPIDLPTIFISYSRRQLYFAEALTLHLQQAGLDVWFDLQQLKAGSVWSDGLKDGIGQAGKLILVVSKASLASSYVEEEWRGVLESGNPVVLAICEPVVLPDELRGLPTYDFTRGFTGKLAEITAFLQGKAAPQYDRIAVPNAWRDYFRIPWPALLVISTYFLTFFTGAVGLYFIGGDVDVPIIFTCTLSLAILLWHGIPFLQRKPVYRKIRRSVLWILPLLFLQFIWFVFQAVIIAFLDWANGEEAVIKEHGWPIYVAANILAAAYILFVYYVTLARSSTLLRWMGPEDDLQPLRRRVHQPLIKGELTAVDMASQKNNQTGVSFAVHSDPADRSIANWITNIFETVGHRSVSTEEHWDDHIAVISNRTSGTQIQAWNEAYEGKLILVVVTTVELNGDLQKAEQYQWVDARDLDEEDIIGLAHSLGTQAAGKKAGLESTPNNIDDWVMPMNVRVLRTILLACIVICFCRIIIDLIIDPLTMEAPPDQPPPVIGLLAALGVVATGSFWLIRKGLIYRRMPAWSMYAIVLSICAITCFIAVPPIEDSPIEIEYWPTRLGVFSFIILLLLVTARKGRIWFPVSSIAHTDELGASSAVIRSWHTTQLVTVVFWIVFWSGIYLVLYGYVT